MKIGLLGCGAIGQTHSQNLLKLGRKLSFVHDPDASRAEALGKPHGARTLPSLEALLNESDAVIIATPDFRHFEEALQCVKAGKDVFCEKPVSLTVEQGRQIQDALRGSKSRFMSGYVLRYFPPYRKAKEILGSGTLGRFVSAASRRMGHLDYSDRPWVGQSAQSGGVAVHFLSHDLDFQIWLAGKPRTVSGWTFRASPDKRFDIDDNASALLTFERGSGTAAVSWTSPAPEWFFEIIGEDGTLTFRDEQLTLRRLKKDPEVLSTEGDGFEGIMKAFVEGLEQGHEFSPGFEDALLALTVAHAVQESSRTEKTIHLAGKP